MLPTVITGRQGSCHRHRGLAHPSADSTLQGIRPDQLEPAYQRQSDHLREDEGQVVQEHQDRIPKVSGIRIAKRLSGKWLCR